MNELHRELLWNGSGAGRVAHAIKLILLYGVPHPFSVLYGRVGGENVNKRETKHSRLHSPGFPNWNQIRRPTAFLLIWSPSYDKI